MQQVLEALGLPETLVSEIEGRLQSQQKLLGKIGEVMFPAFFGCRTPVRGVLGAGLGQELAGTPFTVFPKHSWLKWLWRLGLEVLVPLWHHMATKKRGDSQSLAVDLGHR